MCINIFIVVIEYILYTYIYIEGDYCSVYSPTKIYYIILYKIENLLFLLYLILYIYTLM